MHIQYDQWRRVLTASTLSAACVLILLPGCASDPATAPLSPSAGSTQGFAPDRGLPVAPVLSMAEELIAQIEAAYEGQDRDAYAQLFDPERFVFVFDPIDVQENPDLPDSWGWPEEESVHRNMFEGGEVESIQLDWDSVQNLPVTQWDGAGEPLPPGTREVVVSGVHLTIEVRDPQGEILVFEVEGDRAHLFVARENAGALGGSPPRWKILRWQDERVGGKLATETLSWGVVKSFFR